MNKRQLLRASSSLLAVMILSALGLGLHQNGSVGLPTAKQGNQPGYYPVTHVSDGDTISVKIAGTTETVRLIGIDTPEEKDPRKPVQCFALAAAENMQKLVQGKSVRLEGDAADTDRDKYHRLLRYVYLPDGTFVNQVQVQQGYGFAYTLFPFSMVDQFRGWEAEARQNNRGLWTGCQIHKEGQKEQTQNAQ